MTQLVTVLRTLALAQPIALLVLILAVPFVVISARTRLRLTSRQLRAGVVVTRLAIVALVVLALAQPTLRATGRGRAVVFAVDVSDSITPDQLAWARTWVDQRDGRPSAGQSFERRRVRLASPACRVDATDAYHQH